MIKAGLSEDSCRGLGRGRQKAYRCHGLKGEAPSPYSPHPTVLSKKYRINNLQCATHLIPLHQGCPQRDRLPGCLGAPCLYRGTLSMDSSWALESEHPKQVLGHRSSQEATPIAVSIGDLRDPHSNRTQSLAGNV